MTDRTTVLGKDRQLRMHLIMVFNVDYMLLVVIDNVYIHVRIQS